MKFDKFFFQVECNLCDEYSPWLSLSQGHIGDEFMHKHNEQTQHNDFRLNLRFE
jgi:hypothetical protein